jgi:hypothetical protein
VSQTHQTNIGRQGRPDRLLPPAEYPADLGQGHAESVLAGSLVSLQPNVTPLGSYPSRRVAPNDAALSRSTVTESIARLREWRRTEYRDRTTRTAPTPSRPIGT